MRLASYELDEELPPHWLGNLAGHLAAHSIDVRSLTAEQMPEGRWTVKVQVASTFDHPSARELAEMARLSYDRGGMPRGELHQYWLVNDDSCLYLSLRAEDRVGFLAQLCADLAAHALFPVRVDARCRDNLVTDGLWLRGIGHSVPHDETAASLNRFLEAWRSGTLPPPSSSLRPPSMRPAPR